MRALIAAAVIVTGTATATATVAVEVEFTDGAGRDYRIEASISASGGEVRVHDIDTVEIWRNGRWESAYEYDEGDISEAVITQTEDPWSVELECIQTEWNWVQEARGDAQREGD